MGKIELDHTGSGGGVTLSSDGTDLLLDGTAIGGGADLYAAETTGSTDPTATGTLSLAIGSSANGSGTNSVAIGNGAAAGTYSVGIGWNAGNTGSNNTIIGRTGSMTGTSGATVIGYDADASNYSLNQTALGYRATTSSGAQATALTQSYASGADSFAAAIGNNTSTYGATGASSVALGYRAKSSGSFSSIAFGLDAVSSGRASIAIGEGAVASADSAVSLGEDSTASGANSSVLGGLQNTASALRSVVLNGYQNTASGEYSVASGVNAKSDKHAKVSHSGGQFSAQGDAQTGTFVLRSDTTDATPEALTANNSTAGTTNQVVLPNDSVYGFTGTVIAREDSSSTDDFAVWEIKGGAVRGASASTTALGSYNINKISESTGASNWSIALSADTTNGAVAITVTGEAAHNIRWVATVNTTEVTY